MDVELSSPRLATPLGPRVLLQSGTGHHLPHPPWIAYFKCSLSSSEKAVLKTRGNFPLLYPTWGPHAPV